MKKLLCLMLFCLLLNSTIYGGNKSGFMTTDQKAALDGANAPSASNVLATEADVAAADTGVQTAGAGVNLSNSGDTDNPIFDLDISENVDMDTNQLTNLKLPAGLGQAVRTTAKISEVNTEDAIDKKHAQNTDKILQSGGEAEDQKQTDVGSGYYDTADDPLAQVFTAGKSGALSKVKLRLYKLSDCTKDLIVELRTTDGSDYPTDVVLDTETILASSIPGELTWLEVAFSTPYDVVSSTKYALVIKEGEVGISKYRWYYNDPGSYGGGTCFFYSGGWVEDTQSDYGFYTYVTIADADLIDNGELKQDLSVAAGKKIGTKTIEQYQDVVDKVEVDSSYWDLMSDKVNDDSTVWADKYTQAQITDYLALKLDIADSPVIDDTAYNPTSWDGNNDAATKNAIRDKIVDIDTAVGLNTAKDTNVPTALSEGTRDDTTYGINSDGGNDDIILPQANTNQAGLLSGTKWNEIVANTAKDTNVSTDLSEGTSTDTTVDVNSSDGNNMTLQPASTSRAGVMSKAKFDEVVANNAKDTNVPTALSVGTVGENTVAITSDSGADDVTLPAATNSTAGMMTKAKFDEVVANTAKANSLTRYLYWSPAYNGYTLSADGSNNDAGDSGIIVAFAGTLGDSAVEDTPYIEWSSTTAGVNDYDIIIRIPIPSDYSSMGTMTVEYLSDTVLEDTATIYLYDSNDAADSSVVLSSSAWAIDETMSPSGTYAAGKNMTIKLHMECAQNQKMRVGEIRCSYTATR